ncbi:MAG: TetR/AcrR family transcriptional regulator [Syntrophaceae bacterium]|nr:TetR/AcrR family transcriptional regulator [Syntrophaceae bacterium]
MVRSERKEREFNARRAEILNTAEKIFSIKAYHEVTMAEIATASGFSTGSLYQFFEGKENLYTAMIGEKLDLMFSEIRKATEKAENVIEKIEVLVDFQLQFMEKNADFCRLYAKGENAALSEAMTSLREKLIDYYFKHITFIENLLKDGIDKGLIRNMPANDMAQSLFHLIRAATSEWMLSLKNDSPCTKKGFILDIFFNGVKNHDR